MGLRTFLSIIFLLSAAPLFAAEPTAMVRVADGFDFPVGKPNGAGYYKARGFRSHGHLGEDWNGGSGGDTDLGDAVYSIGNGVVILARNVRLGWGNVVIVRHAYYDGGQLQYIDSLYGHLDRISVREGQSIGRGDQLGTIGNNFGMYDAHLHFEVRKNLAIGMNRASYARDFTNYYDPTAFINARRSINGGPERTLLALNTTHYPGLRGQMRAAAEQVPIETRAPRVDMNPELSAAPAVTTNTSGRQRGVFTVDRFSDLR